MGRKKANIHYIYKTTCNVTGRYYIGMHSTINLEDGYMGSGTVLRRSIRKYGVENHVKEILEFCDSREELVLREIEIVNKELINDSKCMNLKQGSNGGFSDEQQKLNAIKSIAKQRILRETDPEWVKKISEKRSSINKKLFEEGILNKNWGKDWTGCKHSDKTIELMREIKKGTGIGEKNSQYGTCWITKEGVNKKIKKEDIDTYLKEGWTKGRKVL